MKILRWSLLSVAIAFLIVPIGTIPVYAEEREFASDSESIPMMAGSGGSSNGGQMVTVPKQPAVHFPFEHQTFGKMSFAVPILGLVLWGLYLSGWVVAGVATLAGATLAVIGITEYVKAKIDKGEYEFLQQYTDEDAKRFANSLEKHVEDLIEECANHNYTATILDYRQWIEINVQMEFNFDKSTGDVECKDPITGTLHFMKNIDQWIKDTYDC